MSKASNYEKKSTSSLNDIISLNTKLSKNLKDNIKHIDSYPIFSEDWLKMAETFGYIANISSVELKLTSEGKNSDGTLWESEEQAVKLLMEASKLPVIFRLLLEYKLREIMSRTKHDELLNIHREHCDKFEKGVGIIFKNAWLHIEVLLTADILALTDYIVEVIKATTSLSNSSPLFYNYNDILGRSSDDNELYIRQEYLVIVYLNYLLKNIDEIDENRFIPTIRQNNLFPYLIKAVIKLFPHLNYPNNSNYRITLLETLSYFVTMEDFMTNRSKYYSLNDDELSDNLDTLKNGFLDDLMTDLSYRKVVKPFYDFIEKYNRDKQRK